MITAKTPRSLEEATVIITDLQDKIAHLSHQLDQMKRMIFGQKTERHVPAVPEEQMALEGLFEQVQGGIPGFAETSERITYDRRKPKKGHGRKPIPDDLHREMHVLDIPEAEKACNCCGEKKNHIGDDITEELEYKPAVFFVNQYVRPKYACPRCADQGIATAALPDRPIDKGIAGTGLLSYILVSKYVDHLPLYRLEQMFKRYAIEIPRSTMSGWVAQICTSLEPVYRAMKDELIKNSFLIQADETTLKVMDDAVKDKCLLGYLWPFVGDGKLVVFEFRESRRSEGPVDFLNGFKDRFLLSDGYAGYNKVVEQNGLTHLMCWAHARRKFFEVKDLAPEFVDKVLSRIKDLYEIERHITTLVEKKKNPDCRAIRADEAPLILVELKLLLENPGFVVLPKSKLGEAVAYTLNHWAELTRYLMDYRLPIDNNLVENTIRPVALGRKNWLFAGSVEGANRMAIIYSFTATCKILGINIFEYFHDILPRIPGYPVSKIADLTPVHWKMSKSNSAR